MNNLRNSVCLIGNVGQDPEVKELNGKVLTRLSLATSELYKDREGKTVIGLQWHQVIVHGRQAEIVGRLVKKGAQVAVEGRLTHRSFVDPSGAIRYITEILVHDLQVVGRDKATPNVFGTAA